MRKTRGFLTVAVCLVLAATVAWADEIAPAPGAFQNLERVETVLYGGPQPGGLLERLARAEKDLFGRELPGSLTERQTALLQFLEKGTAGQPGFLFKLGVAEWAVAQQVYPTKFAAARLEGLEQLLEGHTQTGPLAMRLERLVTKLLPSGIQGTGVSVPAATLVKVRLLQPLAARFCKTGDKVGLELVDDLRVQGTLVAPRGSRVAAHVQSVEGPRSFGRPSEVKVTFEYLETLGMEQIPVLVGEAAKNATKLDKSLVGAAGASALGMVLLGPVGLAGGFLVRGDDKTVPAGTQFYLETGQAVSVLAYTVPATLGGGVAPTPPVTSTGAINP